MADAPVITAAQLKRYALRCDELAVAPALDAAAKEFGITEPRPLTHWLGQMYVETAGFTAFEENLSYSAHRLTVVWPQRFPTLASAEPYAMNPSGVAEKVYGGRLGNRNPGDGWRYRGSGMLDHTGLANFQAIVAAIGVDVVRQPDLLRTDRKVAARAAGAFWKLHGLSSVVAVDPNEHAVRTIADEININEADDVAAATRIIEGGQLGLAERRRQVLRASMIWRP